MLEHYGDLNWVGTFGGGGGEGVQYRGIPFRGIAHFFPRNFDITLYLCDVKQCLLIL